MPSYLPLGESANEISDFDNAPNGVFAAGGQTLNSPTGAVMVCEQTSGGSGAILVVRQTAYRGNGEVWQRANLQNTWSDWQRIDNYGTSSLSDLASALGVVYNNSEGLSGDLSGYVETITKKNGIILSYVATDSSSTYYNYSLIIQFLCGNSSAGYGMEFNCGTNGFKARKLYYENNKWNAAQTWRKIE